MSDETTPAPPAALLVIETTGSPVVYTIPSPGDGEDEGNAASPPD